MSFERATRKPRRSLPLFFLLASTLSLAEVPNVFVPATPAKASEVNANFADLDARLAAIEDMAVPEVSVDCDVDAEALQEAVNGVSPRGARILVTGTCNGVNIVNKQNLSIDGQGETTIVASTDRIPLDIAISSGVFINNLIADAADLTDSALIVGGSTAILTDVTAINGTPGDGTMSVWVNSIAVLRGTTVIGDGGDEVALEINERGTVLTEGSLTISGITAIEMSMLSVFDQDTDDDPGETLTINGDINIAEGSYFEIENGSLNGEFGVYRARAHVLPRNPGFHVAINGQIIVVGTGGLLMRTDDIGTVAISGSLIAYARGSVNYMIGTGITLPATTLSIFWGAHLLTGSDNPLPDGMMLNIGRLGQLQSGTYIDPAKVTVQCLGTVSAIGVNATNTSSVDLCEPAL